MKRRLSLFLTIVMMLSCITISNFSVQASAPDDSVTTAELVHLTEVPTGYVGIYTKSDLDNIRNNLSGNYILMNDIDFSTDDFLEVGQFYNSGKGWNSIGNNETPFTGIFDGNGYCINDLNISGSITESLYVGLFGYNKGTIRNVVTVSGQIDITHASNTVYVGMVAGYSEGTIENCKSFGEVNVESTILRATYETPYSYVGGITGYSVGTLSLCENTCNIQVTPSVISYAEAVAYLGGVAGIANTSTVSNCTNSGAITLTPSLDADTGITVYAGGILGQSNGNTSGCDNNGSVIIEEFDASSTSNMAIEAKFYVAGIIGYSNGTITGSNNAGTIRARGVYAYSGGVAGYNAGTLSQCSNIGNIMAITTSTGSAAYSYGYSGGIAGYSNGTTSESYNTGFVQVHEAGASEAAYSGGIVSYQAGGTIINCYNAGYVPDKTFYGDTGGIAGYSTGSISLCYNIGRVPECAPTGGGAIVGYTSQITPNCFFLNDNKVGVAEGKDSTISCSKEALLLPETYTGFDFNSVWEIGIYDTYPCATLKNVEHKGGAIGNGLFAGGTGTAYDPFLIENAEQLNNVSLIPSAYYELIADITFKDSDYAEGGAFYNDGEGWFPIMYFAGSFDGRGHVINNLQIYHAPTSSVSSYSSSNAHYSRSYANYFGLFGCNNGGTISRVGVTGNIYVKIFDEPAYRDSARVGGIAGWSFGTISECYFIGNVYGTAPDESGVGGIAGQSYGTISECYFMGSVYGSAQDSSRVGGICGASYGSKSTLENCFSKGTFTSNGFDVTTVGGITGDGSYSNCYSTGRVVKKGSSSNIAMVRGSGDVVNCTEADMIVQSTYADFDFNSIWTMEGNPNYPYPELKNVNTFYDRKALSICITTLPNKLVYKGGLEELNLTGGKIKVTYDDDTVETIDMSSYMVAGFNNRVGGTQTVTLTYAGCSATFEVEVTLFVVTFKDWNGNILSKQEYPYGDLITAPLTPTKASDNTFNYIFAGWDKDLGICNGNETFTAVYNSEYINYVVVFKNYNGDVISTKTYHYGDAIVVPGAPKKPSDENYSYVFTGWDKSVTNCYGDAEYTAQFTAQDLPIVAVDSSTTRAGEIVTLNVVLSNAPELESLSISEITYNTSALELISVEWKVTNALLLNWDDETGMGAVMYSSPTDLNGTILAFSFKIKDGTADGNYPVSCKVASLECDLKNVSGEITVCSVVPGDVDGNELVDKNDAIRLMMHIMFPSTYPLNQNADFTGDSIVDKADAIYLMMHIMFPSAYPIK